MGNSCLVPSNAGGMTFKTTKIGTIFVINPGGNFFNKKYYVSLPSKKFFILIKSMNIASFHWFAIICGHFQSCTPIWAGGAKVGGVQLRLATTRWDPAMRCPHPADPATTMAMCCRSGTRNCALVGVRIKIGIMEKNIDKRIGIGKIPKWDEIGTIIEANIHIWIFGIFFWN